MSLTIQYIIVGAILSATAIWIAFRFHKKKQGNDSMCNGCGLYDACNQKGERCGAKEKKGRTERASRHE